MQHYDVYGLLFNTFIENILWKNLKKLRTSATSRPDAWKKIASLLNSSPELFWSIIKLYSSSFNPMLKSLNNKDFMHPKLLGKGTAQLKFLKKKFFLN